MRLNIAGFNIEIETPETYIGEHLNQFQNLYPQNGSQNRQDAVLTVFKGNPHFEDQFNFTRHSNGLFHHRNGIMIFITEAYSIYIDQNENRVRGYSHNPECACSCIEVTVIACTRLFLSLLVIENGGLPLHSSCVAINNKNACIFTGASKSGKTTLSELLKDKGRVFNDEFNLIMPIKDEFHVYSNPLTKKGNRFSPYATAPLDRILLLKKSVTNRISQIKKENRILSLLKNVYSVPFTQEYWSSIVENTARITLQVPVKELYFTIEKSCYHELMELLGAE